MRTAISHQRLSNQSEVKWQFVPAVAQSVNGVTIRLTSERWLHITEEHAELAGYFFDVLEVLEKPAVVFEGTGGELLAAREIEPAKHLVVVYKELTAEDGFVITAFLTRRIRQLDRRKRVWPR